MSTTTRDVLIKAFIDFTAGCAGGVANVAVGQPLDTIKVKLQTYPRLYASALACGFNTLKTEGLIGLYAGTGPALVANIAEDAVLFLSYGAVQRFVVKYLNKDVLERDALASTPDLISTSNLTSHSSDENAAILRLTPLQNACAGSVASVSCGMALTPVELVKCRLQALQETQAWQRAQGLKVDKSVGSLRMTARIMREEGVTAIFKGLEASLVRKIIGYFFFFGCYEYTRDAFVGTSLSSAAQSKDAIGALPTIIAGGVGGVAHWIPSYPIDTVKSRIQVLYTGPESPPHFVKVLLDVVKTEGIGSLYRGIGPTLLRTFPATGALFYAMEETKKFLHANCF